MSEMHTDTKPEAAQNNPRLAMHSAHKAELHTDTKPEQSNMEENGEYGSI
jgi:hypothetical protein